MLSPGYTGRCTAPLLVDKVARRIVCSESSVLVRCLGRLEMEGGTGVELYPAALAAEIDAWNDRCMRPGAGWPSGLGSGAALWGWGFWGQGEAGLGWFVAAAVV